MASSLARYRRCLKPAGPTNVKCTFVEPPPEECEPFPWFTKELYVSVFKPQVPDPHADDIQEMDHNNLLKTMDHLSTGRLGETVTAVKKDLMKYPNGYAAKPDVRNVVAVTAMKADTVDYLDCVRNVGLFRVHPKRVNPSPFICHVLLSFRSRLPYQIEYYYMVCEYWNKGTSLCVRMQNVDKLSEEHTRFYLMQIADALMFLHDNGHIVRRLCLCNLLLEPNGFVRLAPYSLCEANLDSGQACNMLHRNCGDQFYASPEVVFGVDVTPAADWWSCGVILFQMLTGELPFTGRTLGDLGKAITESPFTIPSELSGEVSALLKQLLHKDHRRRAGAREVTSHPWFKGFPWVDVRDANMQAPYSPQHDNKTMFPQKKLTSRLEIGTKKEVLRRSLEPVVTGQACQKGYNRAVKPTQ